MLLLLVLMEQLLVVLLYGGVWEGCVWEWGDGGGAER